MGSHLSEHKARVSIEHKREKGLVPIGRGRAICKASPPQVKGACVYSYSGRCIPEHAQWKVTEMNMVGRVCSCSACTMKFHLKIREGWFEGVC